MASLPPSTTTINNRDSDMAQTGFWRIAARAPDAVALVDPEQRSWRRGELLDEVHRLTHGLTALGLQQGDAVAIMAPNRWQFVALSLAATQAGLYLVPINWHLAAPEAAHILRDKIGRASCRERVQRVGLARS